MLPLLCTIAVGCAPSASGCVVSRECGAGFFCTNGECVEESASGCLSSEECDDGVCVAGRCMPRRDAALRFDGSVGDAGAADTMTPFDAVFDAPAARGRPLCDSMRSCAPGFLCRDGGCRSASDFCQFDSECAGQRCLDGLCGASCSEGRGCLSADQECIHGVCVARSGCSSDAMCPGGACRDSVCIRECMDEMDCGEGHYCDRGLCYVDDRATPCGDRDCPCLLGSCREPCEVSGECMEGLVCRTALCVEPHEAMPQCARSDDCASGEYCLDAQCRESMP